MGRRVDQNDPDEVLLRQFHRVAGEFRCVTGMRDAFAGFEQEGAPAADRKAALATLSEVLNVLALMTARREELRRQLNQARGQLGAASAYARTSALSAIAKRALKN
jgi:hypothetical protein